MIVGKININRQVKIKDDIYFDTPKHSDSESFGVQWNKFRETQIDKDSNTNSYDRFFNETGYDSLFFDNKNILEIGSGAGRFSNIILKHTKAKLFSIEPSSAIYANKKNNFSSDVKNRFFLFKSSLYDLPFEKEQFDIVICFGVLQHTPNIDQSLICLTENLKKGGFLFLDFYPYNGFWTYIHSKYILRPITKRMKLEKLYFLVDRHLDKMIRIYYFLCKIGLYHLTRFIPIADIKKTIPENIEYKSKREIILLDTIDMLTPKFDKPQKIKNISKKLKKLKLNILYSGKVYYKNLKSAVVRAQKI